MQGLNLHTGGTEVSFEQLSQLPVPAATETHFPVPHHRLVEAVRHTLGFYKHEIVEEHHAIDHGSDRYFGLLSLRSEYGEYEDTIGLRNSNDRKFPIGLAFGGRVFVCSNLSFHGDHVIKRKHTQHAWRDVHGLLAEIIEPLHVARLVQHKAFTRYKATPLTPVLADHALIELYRRGVVNIQRIPEVLEQFEHPAHDWGDKTAWRFFNSVTYTLAGKVTEKPSITQELHAVLDAICN